MLTSLLCRLKWLLYLFGDGSSLLVLLLVIYLIRRVTRPYIVLASSPFVYYPFISLSQIHNKYYAPKIWDHEIQENN
jgi:hypothetical protein